MRVTSAKGIDEIDNLLTLYGACIVQNVLNPADVQRSQNRLIQDHDNVGRFNNGYSFSAPEDGRYGRILRAPFIPHMDEQLAPLNDTLTTLYELHSPKFEYVELVYKPNDMCKQPGLLLHEDIELTYNLALQAVDVHGNPDDRLYIQRNGVHHIQLGLDEILIITGANGVYDPVLHGVKKSAKRRFAQFVLCKG